MAITNLNVIFMTITKKGLQTALSSKEIGIVSDLVVVFVSTERQPKTDGVIGEVDETFIRLVRDVATFIRVITYVD